MAKIKSARQYEKAVYEAAEIFNRGDYSTALEKFLDLADANPQNLKVHELLCLIYLRLERMEDAEREYQVCQDLIREQRPELAKFPEKSFEQLVDEAGDKKQAEASYRQVLKSDRPEDVITGFEAATRLALLYMSEGDYRRAEKVLLDFKEKAIQIQSNMGSHD